MSTRPDRRPNVERVIGTTRGAVKPASRENRRYSGAPSGWAVRLRA